MSVVSSLSFAPVRPRARFQVRAGSIPSEAPPPRASRRVLFGAALSTLLISPEIVRADEASISSSSSVRAVAAQPLGDLAAVAPGGEVYFGNGCFWGRQHEFVQTERTRLGRSDDEVSSLVGYAGGFSAKGKDGKVCYYYGAPDTVYERLGHGEVVAALLVVIDRRPWAPEPRTALRAVGQDDPGHGHFGCDCVPELPPREPALT